MKKTRRSGRKTFSSSSVFRIPPLHWAQRIFKPATLTQAIRELFSRRPGAPATRRSEARPQRSYSFTLEALEPRLLLSADLSYSAVSGTHDFTLKATQNSGNVYLSLFETSNLSASIDDQLITGGADVNVSVGRDDILGSRAVNGDTVRIDLDTFSLLDAVMSGHTLGVDVQGGDQRLTHDLVTVDGTTGAVGYGLSLNADSQI